MSKLGSMDGFIDHRNHQQRTRRLSGANRFAEFFTQIPLFQVWLAAAAAIVWPALANL
jgi:hypothetical protein